MWLNFALALAKLLAQNHLSDERLEFSYADNILYLCAQKPLNIPKEALRKIAQPEALALALNQKP